MQERSHTVRRVVVIALVGSLFATLAGPASPVSAAPKRRPDRTWMANGRVYALVRAGDRLLIGGDFTQLLPPRGSGKRALEVRNLAAIDLSSGKPVRNWRPRVLGDAAAVRALAVSGGTVYVGGRFDRLAGSAAQNLGAVRLGDGHGVTGFSPEVDGAVDALLASASRLYAGGPFGRVDGVSRAKLAAWDLPSRSLSTEWRPRALGGAVKDLEFDAARTSIFIGGAFDAMAQGGSSFTRESVAKVDAATGDLRSWAIPVGKVGQPQTAWSLAATNERLHGGFGAKPNFAASFQASGTTGTRYWRDAFPGNVQTVELSPNGKRLFLGGHFGLAVLHDRVCGKQIRGLISVRPATGQPFCDWVPQLAPHEANFDGPWTMLAVGSRLWVGGGFGKIGGVEQRNLAGFRI